jgi:hypothetical protein
MYQRQLDALSGGVIKPNPIAVRVDTEIPTLDVDQYTTTKITLI